MGPAGRDLIETVADGYRLTLDPDQVDATWFERLGSEGQRLLSVGEAAAAEAPLAEALRLWRGLPLGEIADSPTGRAAAARLSALREAVIDAAHDAALALGDHDAVIVGVEAALVDDPLRERRWVQLMVALYRSGRQADALRAYQRVRTVLAEQLGLEPSGELRRLEQAILDHDPRLEVGGSLIAGNESVRDVPAPGSVLAEEQLAWVEYQLEVPLVGRDREVEHLVGLWHRVVTERTGGVVFIEGDAGVGKTRLVAELVTRAAAEGALRLRGPMRARGRAVCSGSRRDGDRPPAANERSGARLAGHLSSGHRVRPPPGSVVGRSAHPAGTGRGPVGGRRDHHALPAPR